MAASSSTAGCATGLIVYDASECNKTGTITDRCWNTRSKEVSAFHLSTRNAGECAEGESCKASNSEDEKSDIDRQWEHLFPPSGEPPDSTTFEITLLHLFIRKVCCLPAPLK